MAALPVDENLIRAIFPNQTGDEIPENGHVQVRMYRLGKEHLIDIDTLLPCY